MLRGLLGIAIASVVLYMWGFLFWGVMPFQQWVMKAPADDAAARAALRQHFPENGAYLLPSANPDMEVLEANFVEGPVAMVNMLRVDGRSAFSSSIMINGFLLNLVVIALLAGILSIAARPKYIERVQLSGAIGLAAALLINYGGVVWWEMSRPWELYNGAYNFSFFLLAGAILGLFVKPRARAAAEAQ